MIVLERLRHTGEGWRGVVSRLLVRGYLQIIAEAEVVVRPLVPSCHIHESNIVGLTLISS